LEIKKVIVMSTKVVLSKDYVKEIVDDYTEIVSHVNEIIGQTGYKGKVIAEKLGIPESSFYQKKRKKSFSLKEMQQIVELMDEEEDDDDEIEDEYFKKVYEERKDGENIDFEDLLKMI
jgi:predicted transcriptional regulator